MKNKIILLSTILFSFLFISCSNKIETKEETTKDFFNGVQSSKITLVDPYISHAILCEDENRNLTCDPGEQESLPTSLNGETYFENRLKPYAVVIMKNYGMHEGLPYETQLIGQADADGNISTISPLTTMSKYGFSETETVALLNQIGTELGENWSFNTTEIKENPLNILNEDINNINDSDLKLAKVNIGLGSFLKTLDDTNTLQTNFKSKLQDNTSYTYKALKFYLKTMNESLDKDKINTINNNLNTINSKIPKSNTETFIKSSFSISENLTNQSIKKIKSDLTFDLENNSKKIVNIIEEELNSNIIEKNLENIVIANIAKNNKNIMKKIVNTDIDTSTDLYKAAIKGLNSNNPITLSENKEISEKTYLKPSILVDSNKSFYLFKNGEIFKIDSNGELNSLGKGDVNPEGQILLNNGSIIYSEKAEDITKYADQDDNQYTIINNISIKESKEIIYTFNTDKITYETLNNIDSINNIDIENIQIIDGKNYIENENGTLIEKNIIINSENISNYEITLVNGKNYIKNENGVSIEVFIYNENKDTYYNIDENNNITNIISINDNDNYIIDAKNGIVKKIIEPTYESVGETSFNKSTNQLSINGKNISATKIEDIIIVEDNYGNTYYEKDGEIFQALDGNDISLGTGSVNNTGEISLDSGGSLNTNYSSNSTGIDDEATGTSFSTDDALYDPSALGPQGGSTNPTGKVFLFPYVKGIILCEDKNKNWNCDADEQTSTPSDENGIFTFPEQLTEKAFVITKQVAHKEIEVIDGYDYDKWIYSNAENGTLFEDKITYTPVMGTLIDDTYNVNTISPLTSLKLKGVTSKKLIEIMKIIDPNFPLTENNIYNDPFRNGILLNKDVSEITPTELEIIRTNLLFYTIARITEGISHFQDPNRSNFYFNAKQDDGIINRFLKAIYPIIKSSINTNVFSNYVTKMQSLKKNYPVEPVCKDSLCRDDEWSFSHEPTCDNSTFVINDTNFQVPTMKDAFALWFNVSESISRYAKAKILDVLTRKPLGYGILEVEDLLLAQQNKGILDNDKKYIWFEKYMRNTYRDKMDNINQDIFNTLKLRSQTSLTVLSYDNEGAPVISENVIETRNLSNGDGDPTPCYIISDGLAYPEIQNFKNTIGNKKWLLMDYEANPLAP